MNNNTKYLEEWAISIFSDPTTKLPCSISNFILKEGVTEESHYATRQQS